jgi:hypothetical protein
MAKKSGNEKRARASSAGLKRSPAGVNRPGLNPKGVSFVEVLDGLLYVEHLEERDFKRELKALCKRFNYRFVPSDEFM